MAAQDVARHVPCNPLGDQFMAELDQPGQASAPQIVRRGVRNFEALAGASKSPDSNSGCMCLARFDPTSAGKRKAWPLPEPALSSRNASAAARGRGKARRPAVVFDVVTVIEGDVLSRSIARHSSEHASSARKPMRSVSMRAARVGALTGTG